MSRSRLHLPLLAVLLVLPAACSTSADYGNAQAMSCAELNNAVTQSSSDISRTAVRRGRIGNVDIPSWLPGGASTQQALVDRSTTRLDTERSAQADILAERNSRCRS